MIQLLLICTLAVTWSEAMRLDKKDACEAADCRAGRECVIVEGMAQCLCALTCPDHFKPICGTDGESYENHCLLHRHACITGEHISVRHKGFCKDTLSKSQKQDISHAKMSKIDIQEELQHDLLNDLRADMTKDALKEKSQVPAVCYSSQRDALRYLLVAYWEENLKVQPWYVEGMTYRESLWGWFYSCDEDKDNHLTPDEVAKCSKDTPFFARADQDEDLTKVLCIDALIDDGDSNHDWRLDFEEFTTIMNPKYIPKEKNCSLDGKKYKDGETVRVYCNHCICAVGNWVCASQDCHTKPADKESFGYMEGKEVEVREEKGHGKKETAKNKRDELKLQSILNEEDYYNDFEGDSDVVEVNKKKDEPKEIKLEKDYDDEIYKDNDYSIDEIIFKSKDKKKMSKKQKYMQMKEDLSELKKKTTDLSNFWKSYEDGNKEKKYPKKEKTYKKQQKLKKALKEDKMVDIPLPSTVDLVDTYGLTKKSKEQPKKDHVKKSKDRLEEDQLWKDLLETNRYNENHNDLWMDIDSKPKKSSRNFLTDNKL